MKKTTLVASATFWLCFFSGCGIASDMVTGMAQANTMSAYRNISVEFYGPDRTASCVIFNKDIGLVLFGNSLVGRTHFKEVSSTQLPVITTVETLKIQLSQSQYNQAAAEVAGMSLEEHDNALAEERTVTATVEMVKRWAREQIGYKELPEEIKKFFTRRTFTAFDNTKVKFFPEETLPQEQ